MAQSSSKSASVVPQGRQQQQHGFAPKRMKTQVYYRDQIPLDDDNEVNHSRSSYLTRGNRRAVLTPCYIFRRAAGDKSKAHSKSHFGESSYYVVGACAYSSFFVQTAYSLEEPFS